MIPERYKTATYAHIPKEIQSAVETMKDHRKGLYIFGAVGTGKTHIAYALKDYYDKEKKGAIIWGTTELLREMRQDINREPEEKKRVDQILMDTPMPVILDDVGAEKMSDWVLETFYLIINKRYNDMLPIICTSNFSIGDLASRIGDRTASRLVEMCLLFELDGKDKRTLDAKSVKIKT